MTSLEPFPIAAPDKAPDRIRTRAAGHVRQAMPDGGGRTCGGDLDEVKALRPCRPAEPGRWMREAKLDRFLRFTAPIQGFDVHAVHEQGGGPALRPLRRTRRGAAGAAVALLMAGVLAAAPFATMAGDVAEALEDVLARRDVAGAVALLDAGADPDTRLDHGKTVLMAAAKAGAADLASRLIEHGADVNARNDNGGTALMFAAIPGDAETMGLLIDRGAEVDAAGHFNWTALMVAASKGHGECVRLLLAHGADPNVQDTYGWTPLMRAVYGNKRAAAAALLEHDGVALEMRDERGATALHVAVERGHPALVAELLAHGADPGSTDDAGRGPLLKASMQGYDDIASMLETRTVQ